VAENDDDRIHEATQQKLQQAREKGDIIYSPEVGAALSLIVVTGVVAFMSGPIVAKLARNLVGFLAMPAQFSTDAASLRQIAGSIGLMLVGVFGMVAIALSVAGLAARYVQDRPTFTGERLSPKLSKLNPAEGFKRVFGKAAASSFLKSLAKLAVVGSALAWALWPQDASLVRIGLIDAAALLPYVQDRAVAMLMAMASAATVLAIIDYVFTRQSYMKRLRMSPREMKEEMRQSDGDPMVKAKLRQIRIQRSRQRMMASIPQASVVITNPTHYAVALRYEPGETPAPICLAKGMDAVAQRIRAAAEEHGVPIIENPPLARALFAAADIDQPIPKEHYEAAAKVIGFVLRLARRKRRGGLANG
jgi:flagellar biosynthetic protein FlhB